MCAALRVLCWTIFCLQEQREKCSVELTEIQDGIKKLKDRKGEVQTNKLHWLTWNDTVCGVSTAQSAKCIYCSGNFASDSCPQSYLHGNCLWGGGGTGQWKYWASKFQMFRDPSPPAFPFAGEILQCHVTFKNVTTTWRLAYVTTVWRGSPHVENMGPHSPDIEYLDLCFWQLFFVDGVFFFGGSTWCWTLWASKHSTSSDPPAPFPCSHGRERWLLIFWSEEYVPTKHSVWRNKIIWCRFYLDP